MRGTVLEISCILTVYFLDRVKQQKKGSEFILYIARIYSVNTEYIKSSSIFYGICHFFVPS